MQTVTIRDAYIKLEQAMKLTGDIPSGADAKHAIQNGEVLVNDETELRRGRKLKDGDIFSFDGHDYRIAGA